MLWTLTLKDEHGRIIVSEEVEKRDEDHVKPFLARLKGLGLKLKTFYLDHCQAYVNAIKAEYPEAKIQGLWELPCKRKCSSTLYSMFSIS